MYSLRDAVCEFVDVFAVDNWLERFEQSAFPVGALVVAVSPTYRARWSSPGI